MKNKKASCISILILSAILFNSCSSSESSKNKGDDMGSISPGNAYVKARVLDLIEEDENNLYKIKILEVLEYGAGTPLLPAGSETNLHAQNISESNKKLKKENEVSIQIFYSEGRGEKDGYWTLVRFLN